MLRIRDLTVRYGRATALLGVSFDAAPGAVTAVTGPNGAGKSSLLRAINGSVDASGDVALNETSLMGKSPASRRRLGVGFVPQGRQIFPHLTVTENLQVMAASAKLESDEVDQAIDRFPILRERARALAGVLSGGEQQMLAVSRALMGDPQVLLLDEMTTGLAPKIVESLLQTAIEFAQRGAVVVVAEPSLNSVMGAVSAGVVLLRGEVVAETSKGGGELNRLYKEAMGLDYHLAKGPGHRLGDEQGDQHVE